MNPNLDHEPVIVTETPDNPVVRQHDLQQSLEPIRTELIKHRIGLAFLGAMIALPKFGGPSATEVITAVADAIGTATTVAVGIVSAAALAAVDYLTR